MVRRTRIHKPSAVLRNRPRCIAKLDRHPPVAEPMGPVQAVRRQKTAVRTCKQSLRPSKVDRTARTVSAQRTQASVGVVVVDAKIRAFSWSNDHEPVRAHPVAAVADFSDQNGRPKRFKRAAYDDKVVSASMVLDKTSEHTANVGRGTVFEFRLLVI